MAARPNPLPLILAFCLAMGFVLVRCQSSNVVTLHGEPVTDAAFIAAATTVHYIEVGAVALGDGLLAHHTAACGSLPLEAQRTDPACVRATSLLRINATEIAPKLLIALQGAKAQLQLAGAQPSATTAERLAAALATLVEAATAMHAWAEGNGFPVVQGGLP